MKNNNNYNNKYTMVNQDLLSYSYYGHSVIMKEVTHLLFIVTTSAHSRPFNQDQ